MTLQMSDNGENDALREAHEVQPSTRSEPTEYALGWGAEGRRVDARDTGGEPSEGTGRPALILER